MRVSIEARVAKLERRLWNRGRGVHRYTDGELDDLITWLRDPIPEGEARALVLLGREGLLP